MTTPEITRIRAALAAYQAATTLAETLDAVGEVEDACSADVMPAVLAHIDAQQAEIELLRADAARLEWYSNHTEKVLCVGTNWYSRSGYQMPMKRCSSFSAAIDAAIAAMKG